MRLLTGQMVYEAWRRQEPLFELPDWHDEINVLVRPRFEGMAEDLNLQLSEHQTQPLVEEQPPTLQEEDEHV